ncbi:beta-glucosidase [Phenylobacterium sp. LjRoot225]|uniref:beta-glucosidase n=1 Tax=Phenylobacterium sp. LjRoot225 TaxID=3342285 RepID=UPI003F505C2E
MSRSVCRLAAALLCSTAAAHAAPSPRPDEAEARAAAVLTQMTPQERRVLLRGYVPYYAPARLLGAPNSAGVVPGVPRLGVPNLTESDASLGVANLGGVMRAGDGATALPSAAALAATWDPALVEKAGAAIGAEARAKGFNVLLAGGVNLVREPRNGRNFEYFSEDPLLSGTLVGHAIRGVQSNAIISTIKHFALNAQETGRGGLSANMAEAALRESDLLAFEIGVEIGRPGSVMCAYNQVNGVYACENSFLLNDVLRRDWGYKGFVMSDWGAVHSTSIREGLDQESGTNAKKPALFGEGLETALASGKVAQADVDRAALRILTSMYRLGVVDRPVKAGEPIDFEANGRVAREVAESGIVLLKNEGQILPIGTATQRILVIGAHADVGVLGGGGSSQVLPVGGAALTLPLPGEPIYHKKMYAPSSPLLALRALRPGSSVTYDDGTDPARAAAAARDAQLVVVFAEQFTAEGKDVPDLSLPNGQDALIAAVAAANPKTVVVLETGGPVLMPWLDKVSAVLEAWYPGQRGGEAIARVLTGEIDASGRLPVTFPAAVDQTPNPKLPGSDRGQPRGDAGLYDVAFDEHFPVEYPEGADAGYRWYDRTKAKPLFAFGHGLSYTRFAYSGLELAGGRTLTARFTVANVGTRPGTETAQVYARVGGVKHLVGWERVVLKPGETRTLSVTADPRLLAAFDVKARNWRVAPGAYAVAVGSASDAPRLEGEVRLTGSRLRP